MYLVVLRLLETARNSEFCLVGTSIPCAISIAVTKVKFFSASNLFCVVSSYIPSSNLF